MSCVDSSPVDTAAASSLETKYLQLTIGFMSKTKTHTFGNTIIRLTSIPTEMYSRCVEVPLAPTGTIMVR